MDTDTARKVAEAIDPYRDDYRVDTEYVIRAESREEASNIASAIKHRIPSLESEQITGCGYYLHEPTTLLGPDGHAISIWVVPPKEER